ncbi:MAG: hypothetical protein RIB61_08265 [Roseicyclus sp.]
MIASSPSSIRDEDLNIRSFSFLKKDMGLAAFRLIFLLVFT